MSYAFHTTDVFTASLHGGNPLAVIPDARGLSDRQMLAITREFNYSETVFVFPPDLKSNTRRVRIFTPGGELPFAGHPTVGCAFVLASIGEIPLRTDETRIILEEGVGPVAVLIRSKDGKPVFVQLTAARLPEIKDPPPPPETLCEVLSLEPSHIVADDMIEPEAVSCGVPFLFIPLKKPEMLSWVKVDVAQMGAGAPRILGAGDVRVQHGRLESHLRGRPHQGKNVRAGNGDRRGSRDWLRGRCARRFSGTALGNARWNCALDARSRRRDGTPQQAGNGSRSETRPTRSDSSRRRFSDGKLGSASHRRGSLEAKCSLRA